MIDELIELFIDIDRMKTFNISYDLEEEILARGLSRDMKRLIQWMIAHHFEDILDILINIDNTRSTR